MNADKISQEISNISKKLSKVNSSSPIYNQLLDMLQTAESVHREKLFLSSLKPEDKADSAIEIGSVESVVYTPIYSQEEFLQVVANMYIDKGKK
jgi:hypothetical protein